MGKKKQSPPAAVPETAPALSPRKRAERVLSSQGRAAGYLNSLPEAVQAELAALCSETGELAADVGARVKAIFERYYAAHKAVVDDDPQPTKPPVKDSAF